MTVDGLGIVPNRLREFGAPQDVLRKFAEQAGPIGHAGRIRLFHHLAVEVLTPAGPKEEAVLVIVYKPPRKG
jgi:hypothetical protein